MFGLILWSTLWITLLCQWLPQKNETKFKKNISIGVTLPKEAHEDPEVRRILQEFRKRTDRLFLLLAIPSAAGAFIPDLTVSVICWSVMLVAILVLPMGVFAVENRKLRALKAQKGWKPEAKQQIRVDLGAMVEYPRPRVLEYGICAILCVIPMLLQRKLWWVHLISIGIVAMSYLFAGVCYRKKSETVDGDAERTKALSLLRYKKWKQIWLLSAVYAVCTSASLWAMDLNVTVGMSLVILVSVFFAGAVMGIEMQTRKLQEKLTEESGTEWYADEDDCWLGGMFYYNPHDSHMMVNARTGVGTTMNLASAGGKIVSAVSLLLLAGSLVWMVAAGLEDRSDMELGQTGQIIFCENGGSRYEVPLEEIENLSLSDELPKGLWRVVGTGGQHLLKGRFTATGFSDLRVLVDPTNPPYLLIETGSGTDYLFGSRDPGRTEEIFAQLLLLVNAE